MHFKNQGEAEVFKHEDLRAWSLTYFENRERIYIAM